MGDKLLKLLLLFLTLSWTLFAQTNREWIDTMVDSIAQSRQGVDTTLLSSLKDPFVTQEQLEEAPLSKPSNARTYSASKPKSSNQALVLSAIFNNRAKINNNWYTIGDSIGNYTLKKIENGQVHLKKKDNTSILLTLARPNKKIKLEAK